MKYVTIFVGTTFALISASVLMNLSVATSHFWDYSKEVIDESYIMFVVILSGAKAIEYAGINKLRLWENVVVTYSFCGLILWQSVNIYNGFINYGIESYCGLRYSDGLAFVSAVYRKKSDCWEQYAAISNIVIGAYYIGLFLFVALSLNDKNCSWYK